ncbi:MAG TPA: hypothetical protein VKE22_07020 [Haliangiales bacterium]|nr:hypothetical protein [Haliangiales bacterium]
MKLRAKLAELDLVAFLLVVAVLELALNRLAVPVLRPPGNQTPPSWHRDLDVAGLYLFYLASVLALAIGVAKAWELRRLYVLPVQGLLLAATMLFFGLTAWGIFSSGEGLAFHLESSFILMLLVTGLAMASRPGDAGVKIGFLLLTVPFAVHYYATFAARALFSDGARATGLADTLRDVGQWAVAAATVLTAACFAPRPLLRSFTRPAPLVVGGFVGVVAAMVFFRHEDVGIEIASKGLGIDIHPGAPPPAVLAFALAAAAVAFTLASTLTSPSAARRHVGMGLALVIVGGYAFTWPLAFATVAVGALALAEAAPRVGLEDEEPSAAAAAPPIPEPVWRAYAEAVAGHIGGTLEVDDGGRTRMAGSLGGLPWGVTIDRLAGGGVRAVDIVFGSPGGGEPGWTLAARPEGLLGGAAHPPPPAAHVPVAHTGDAPFDQRFRVRDAGEFTAAWLDEGLRARAAAVLDGWVAAWPGAGIRYRVCPGRGAPLDHPVPQSELAFRPGDPAAAAERLVRVFDLIAELAAKCCSSSTSTARS